MTLTKEKLKSLYKNKYFNKHSKISERFSNLIELFDEIKNLKKEDLIKNIEPKPSENPFGPAKDSLTRDKAFDGVKAIADKFYEIDDVYHKIIISIGSILGGFDFKNCNTFSMIMPPSVLVCCEISIALERRMCKFLCIHIQLSSCIHSTNFFYFPVDFS